MRNSDLVAEFRPLWDARQVRLTIASGIVASGGAWLLWHASIGDRCAVAMQEVFTVAFLLSAALLFAPRMATWDALAIRRVRMIMASVVAGVLLFAALIPFGIFWIVNRLPPTLVPGEDGLTLDGYSAFVWAPTSANILTIGGVIFLCVALGGRLVGGALALALWVGLIWASIETDWPTGYQAYCVAKAPVAGWPIAATFSAAAIAVWSKTGGTTKWSRSLDARN